MKHYLLLLLLAVTQVLNAQSFEGTLVYKTEYQFNISEKMAEMGITEEAMKEKMKKNGSWSDSVRMVYKQGNYISYTNFNPQAWSVYKQNENKLYAFKEGEGSDICTVTDVSVDLEYQMTGKKAVVTKLDTLVEVNGIKCEIVRVKWKSGIYDYYYHKSLLKTDSKLFENHVYDGWSEFLKISNALPIKIVKSALGLTTVTLTLIRKSDETIDPNLFNIPELELAKDLNMYKIANREVYRIK